MWLGSGLWPGRARGLTLTLGVSQANCIDSTAAPEAVFAAEVKKMQQENMKPQEQLTLEPYERDHAVVVGIYRYGKGAGGGRGGHWVLAHIPGTGVENWGLKWRNFPVPGEGNLWGRSQVGIPCVQR